jgi:CheY-like chemotaxis protein
MSRKPSCRSRDEAKSWEQFDFFKLRIFILRLPMNFPIVPIEEVPPAESVAEATAYRPFVLVVDDQSAIADALAQILNRNGISAVAAYDGASALEIAQIMPPELLVADVALPGMTGIELAIAVRNAFPDCKVLLVSGDAASVELLASAHRAGHEFVLLNKPLHPAELLAQVSECLGPRAGQRGVSFG